jgi:hypothetical protein
MEHINNQAAPAEFVNEIAAAAVLGLVPRRMQYWRQTGDGPPYFKFGSAVRYRISDLLAWADAQRRRSTSDAGS